MFQIDPKEVTSKAAVLRLAAEVIQADMQKYVGKHRYIYRAGCCCAFTRIRTAIYEDRYISLTTRDKKLNLVNVAQSEFTERFKTNDRYAYWMGEQRNNTQQYRRINALLTTAELV